MTKKQIAAVREHLQVIPEHLVTILEGSIYADVEIRIFEGPAGDKLVDRILMNKSDFERLTGVQNG